MADETTTTMSAEDALSALYGSDTFGIKTMEKYLSKSAFKKMLATVQRGGKGKYGTGGGRKYGERKPYPKRELPTEATPETRRLIKVGADEAEHTKFMFDMLLGDNLSARKEFINNNGHDYLDMADIS